MGWNGAGRVIRTDGSRTGSNVWQRAAAVIRKIVSSAHDAHDNDMAGAVENCIPRDGQASPTANISWGDNKITNLADGTMAGDAVNKGQLDAVAPPFIAAANVGGTGDAITLAPTPAVTTPAVGDFYSFVTKAANTGAVTVKFNALAAVSLRKADGTEFASGELRAGRYVTIAYTGTYYQADVAATPPTAMPAPPAPPPPAPKYRLSTAYGTNGSALANAGWQDARSLTVTPSRTDRKIRVRAGAAVVPASQGTFPRMRLTGGSLTAVERQIRWRTDELDAGIVAIDAPASTSRQTYKLQFRSYDSVQQVGWVDPWIELTEVEDAAS